MAHGFHIAAHGNVQVLARQRLLSFFKRQIPAAGTEKKRQYAKDKHPEAELAGSAGLQNGRILGLMFLNEQIFLPDLRRGKDFPPQNDLSSFPDSPAHTKGFY
jgi:hypothetical protein